jgi:hypothetical protein
MWLDGAPPIFTPDNLWPIKAIVAGPQLLSSDVGADTGPDPDTIPAPIVPNELGQEGVQNGPN